MPFPRVSALGSIGTILAMTGCLPQPPDLGEFALESTGDLALGTTSLALATAGSTSLPPSTTDAPASTTSDTASTGTGDTDEIGTTETTGAFVGTSSGSSSAGSSSSEGTGSTGAEPMCGNGVEEGEEECDPGEETVECDFDCTFAACGDGVVNATRGERCDGEPGCSATCDATGCSVIQLATPEAPTGIYLIDPDGAGPSTAVEVLCDMTTDGGGWTLVASTRTTPLSDEASAYHEDLTTTQPEAANVGVWDGLRSALASGRADVRFTCAQDPASTAFDVDLSFYDVVWYHEFTTGTEAESCFSEANGAGADDPIPGRRDNLTGARRPEGDAWDYGYMEGEDACLEPSDFAVDFDDRGMDSNHADGTDWGSDDGSAKCGDQLGLLDGVWHIWVRDVRPPAAE